MGKKNRRSSAGKTNNTGVFDIAKVEEPKLNRKDAIVDKWSTDADIPDEPEDAFDRRRDQVLLDPAAGLVRGRGDDDDELIMDREVMGLTAHYSDSGDEGAPGQGMDDVYDQEDRPQGRRQLAKARLAAKKAGGLPEAPKPAAARLGTPDSSDESSEDGEGGSGSDDDGDEDEDERAKASYFGRNKYAYHGGDDLEALESDEDIDEETKIELEVREARKMQALAREDMTDADFGLAYAIPPKTGTTSEQMQPEVAPAIAGIRSFKDRSAGGAMASAEEREARRAAFDEPSDPDAGPGSVAPLISEVDVDDIRANPRKARGVLLALLRKSAPEKIALAGEFGDELEMHQQVSQALPERVAQHRARREEHAQEMGTVPVGDDKDPGLGLLQLHAQVYNAYATCLSFFMYLATLPSYLDDPAKLRTHPVMGRLLKFKRTLMALEDLGLGLHPKADPTHHGDGQQFMDLSDTLGAGSDGSDGSDEFFEAAMDDSELADLLAEQEKENTLRPRRSRKPAQAPADEPERKPKKKSKKGKEPASDPAPLADVGTFDAAKEAEAAVAHAVASGSGSGKKRKRAADGPSDAVAAQGLGEPEGLSEYDRAERAERKRSLQFYTTQISAREARRGKAKEEKMSGDADLPWRDPAAARAALERKRQAQVLAERAAPAAGTALDDSEFSERDEADRRAVLADDADDGAGYYDLIASSRTRARENKKAEYDAARLAERDEAMAYGEGELEDGEHRGIGRQIEKNKGLTPKRKKEDRNPRVKKRMRYEEAKKKLRSMQATYKGGENAIEGGYGGEASGISSHVIKSRKFA